MSAVAAALLAVPGVLLCAVGVILFREPGRPVRGALDWAALPTQKDPIPPDGATAVARAFGTVFLLAGLLVLVRAALLL